MIRIVVVLLLVSVSIFSGSLQISDFTTSSTETQTTIENTALAIKNYDTSFIQIIRDEALPANSVDSSSSPAIVANSSSDKFTVLWTEISSKKRTIYKSDISISLNGFSKSTPIQYSPNSSDDTLPVMYPNVATGLTDTTPLYTIFDSESLCVVLSGSKLKTQSVFNNSVCHIANDTFALFYKFGNGNSVMMKVAKKNSLLTFTDPIIGDNLVLTHSKTAGNNSIACDSSGNILMTVTLGSVYQSKELHYYLSDRSYTDLDNGIIATGISLNTTDNFNYMDAPIISYADKKFAVMFWIGTTMYIQLLNVSGSPASVSLGSLITVSSGQTMRSPAIALTDTNCIVAWRNLSNNTIEGKQFTISGGVFPTNISSEPTFKISSDETVVDEHSQKPELLVGITREKSIGAVWNQGSDAVLSIWSEKGIKYNSAKWVSPVESLATLTDDSISFKPGSINSTLNGGSLIAYFQSGPGTDTASEWSSWVPLSDSAQLASLTGLNRYYRVRVDLTRNSTDTIMGPTLHTITPKWNVKPIIKQLDSVAVNGVRISTLTFHDTIDIRSDVDTIDIFYTIYDNDSDKVYTQANWHTPAYDTVESLNYMHARVKLIPNSKYDTTYNTTLSATDENGWIAEDSSMFIRVRKPDVVIQSIIFEGDTVSENGEENVVIGKTSTINVNIERQTIVNWNRITYRFKTAKFDTSFTTTNSLSYIADSTDIYMSVYATDAFGFTDSVKFWFIYPKFAIDTVNNPDYLPKVTKLKDSISLMLKADTTDTTTVTIFNSGNDTLSIDSIFFTGSMANWLSIGLLQSDTLKYFSNLSSTNNIAQKLILPDSSTKVYFLVDVSNLIGDSVVYDTVYIKTNDPVHSIDTIPVKLEYNDAPQLVSYNFAFDNKPYWRNDSAGYVFPPHAKLEFKFSEPIDSASAIDMAFAFSYFSKVVTDTIDTITFTETWDSSYTSLFLSPVYHLPVNYFDTLLPTPGFFIPTDSIGVILLSGITDMAQTPSGPNKLDINKDYLPDSTLDTLMNFRVDSITFTIDSIYPDSSSTNIPAKPPFVIEFNSPIYPGTIDTSKIDNKTLIVKSGYFSSIDTMRQISFDTVYISGNKAVFIPSKSFFYGDSVFCYYMSISARDSLGYPIDYTGNGISSVLFDSTSRVDDNFWSFKISDITLDSVFPFEGDTLADINAPIRLKFSQPLFDGAVDTHKTANRTLEVRSLYSESTIISFDTVIVNNDEAIFKLNRRLFYSDSVNVIYHGLITKDSSTLAVDYTGDSLYISEQQKIWWYKVYPLKITSIYPESAYTNADVKDPIVFTFSGPVSPSMFDTSTNADSNKSFFHITSYSGGLKMPLSSVNFSADSTTVTIQPQKAFFSHDSIYCVFSGFNKGYSYLTEPSIIPSNTNNVFSAKSWYFLTGKTNFYTFPNPFKPGSNNRHLAAGGITFKNLHSLKKDNFNVKIKIFNINTVKVFESPLISFKEGSSTEKPQWLWDTKNNVGKPVSSGVYFYVIYDSTNNPLVKGKILIVR